VAGALGLAALLRALRGRRATPPDVSPAPDPADELRAALAERRDAAPPPAADDAGPVVPGTVDERRQQVHERAREALDAMRDDE
jgi:hypothetical protein